MFNDLKIQMEAVSNPREGNGWKHDLHCAKCKPKHTGNKLNLKILNDKVINDVMNRFKKK